VLLAFGVFDDGVLDVDEEVDVELFVVDEVSVGCDAPGVVVFGCDCSSVWVSVGVRFVMVLRSAKRKYAS
jgi:hypothetical protein